MIRPHRTIHKLAWVLLLPLLLGLIMFFSNTGRDLYPINEQGPEIQLKGALP